jgi:radical SAM-linked protein
MIIVPEKDLVRELLGVERPGRYTGGEYGRTKKSDKTDFRIAISFPDLYEIGMSNTAIKVLYSGLNALPGVRCERVFMPAPDFESALKSRSLPLYTLETGTPLSEMDVVAFSVGYELCLTNIMTILDLGGIPIEAKDRGRESPIVLAGGCAVTNPAPFSKFMDAFFIGEAEGGFFELMSAAAAAKRGGADRGSLMNSLIDHPSIWVKGKKAKAAKFPGFSDEKNTAGILSFPVSSMKAVQDHGVVEIMRGCPNGCRFCHAGIYYRPMRMKPLSVIVREIDNLVFKFGYREISLSSLSSGDFRSITELVRYLNGRYGPHKVSFQLPSLRVNSVTLPLLSELSELRKSGLTFAVETPVDAWQRAINKEVYRDRIVDILKEAKNLGWRSAKFYFMIGLPVPAIEGVSEDEAIIDFIGGILQSVKMQLNVNIGTFVPKAHTPYQWAPQLMEENARQEIDNIRSSFRHRDVHVGFHDPFLSVLESLFSRGDERAGDIALAAYRAGCRLDAWDEYVDKDAWRKVLAESGYDVRGEIARPRGEDEDLPWDGVSLNVSKRWLLAEKKRSDDSLFTSSCSSDCDHPCGSCTDDVGYVSSDSPFEPPIPGAATDRVSEPTTEPYRRILFSFEKTGTAAFLSHLNLVNIFERTLVMAGVDVQYSNGFNPIPKMEFALPLSLGLSSKEEIASISVRPFASEAFVSRMNAAFPEGLRIVRAVPFKTPVPGEKIRSLGSLLFGSIYSMEAPTIEEAVRIDSMLRSIVGSANCPGMIEITTEGVIIFIRIRIGSPKELSISRLLGKINEESATMVHCTREKLLSCDKEGNPVSFFQYGQQD